MVAEPEVLAASVESTSDRKVCPELALGTGGSVGPSLAQGAPPPPQPLLLPPHIMHLQPEVFQPCLTPGCLNPPRSPLLPTPPGPAARTFSGSEFHPV